VAEANVVLAGFAPVHVQKPVPQEHLLSYYAWLLASARCAAEGAATPEAAGQILLDVQEKVKRYGVSPGFIARREFNAFPDSEEALGQRGVPPQLPEGFENLLEQPEGPSIAQRMERFESVALQVFRKWYQPEVTAPDDLIHVTCSGYVAPSPAQRFVAEKGWFSTPVMHSYHMGCYGAFPAIRNAVGMLTSPALAGPEGKRRVDIVHTEYLSGHVTTLKNGPADIIDMTLFGDGFIGYSAYPEDVFRSARKLGPGLRVVAAHEELIPGSLEEMTWKLGPQQFDMHLSKNVPLLIRENVLGFARKLCARAGLDFERSKEHMFFAIHPGGPRIVDHTRDVLGISEERLGHTRRVFHELGNMCSATVPYILMDVLQDPAVPAGAQILAMGFGPGLTASGLILQKV
jgi:alkylresorcinol/alkylpyrone synthase